MPDSFLGGVAHTLLTVLTQPLSDYITRKQFEKMDRNLLSITPRQVYNRLYYELLGDAPFYGCDLKDIFHKYASDSSKKPASEDECEDRIWNEDSLRDYLDASFTADGFDSSSVAAVLEASRPVLWRCLHFFAWFPFASKSAMRSDNQDEEVIDYQAFVRSISILAADRSMQALSSHMEGILLHTEDFDDIVWARRLFRALCVPIAVELRVQNGSKTQQMSPARHSMPQQFGDRGPPRGTKLADVIDALAISMEMHPCLVPSDIGLQNAARNLLGIPPREDDSGETYEEVDYGVIPLDDFRKLLTPLLCLRFRTRHDIEIVSPNVAPGSAISESIIATREAIIAAVHPIQPNGPHKDEYITLDEWLGALPFIKGLRPALRRLWRAILKPGVAAESLKVEVEDEGNLLTNPIVQMMALCSIPEMLPDNDGNWPDTKPSKYKVVPSMPAPVPRPRLCDFQSALQVHRSQGDDMSSQKLFRHLSGEPYRRLLLIRGDLDGHGPSFEPALFGAYFTSPLWTVDDKNGQTKYYKARGPTCVFQLTPCLRVMSLRDKLEIVPSSVVLADSLPGTAGLSGADGEKIREKQLQRLVEKTAEHEGIDMKETVDQVASLKASLSKKDLFTIGAYGSSTPALTLDFDSRKATLECNSDSPNLLFDDIINRPRAYVPRQHPWHKGLWSPSYNVAFEILNKTPTQARPSYRVQMNIEQIQVYQIRNRCADLAIRDEEDIPGKLVDFFEQGKTLEAEFWSCLSTNAPKKVKEHLVSGQALRERIQGFGSERDRKAR